MKIKCIVHNVWTSNKKLWLGDTDEVVDSEGKALVKSGKAIAIKNRKSSK